MYSIAYTFRWPSRILLQVVLLIGIATISGWIFELEILKHPLPELSTMNPVTAVVFILLAASFFLLRNPSRTLRVVGYLFAGLPILVTLSRLIEISPFPVPVDQLLFSSQLELKDVNHLSYRMAPATAFNMLLCSLLLFTIHLPAKKRFLWWSLFVWLIGFISLFYIIGYFFRAHEFFEFASHNVMSVQSGICFICLAITFYYAHPYDYFFAPFTGNTAGAQLSRLLVPFVILVPVFLGYARLYLSWHWRITPELGVLLLISTIILALLILVAHVSLLLNRKDRLRQEAETALSRLNSNLEEKIRERTKELSSYQYALDRAAIVAITDQKGIIRYVNENFCRISGYDESELIGQDHRLINSGFHPPEFIRGLWTTIARGGIWKGEIKNKTRDGSYYWVDTTIVPFLDANGKPIRYLAIRADITARKRAEEEREQNERLYRAVASGIPGSVICLIDRDYRYFLVEGDMLERLGYSRTQLLGHRLPEVIPSQRLKEVIPDIERVFAGETHMREDDRGTVNTISHFVPVRDEHQHVYAAMVVVIDVTSLKQAEQRILELNTELELKVEQRTAELDAVVRELEAFTYSVSHDLRAPLRGIVGFTNILEEDFADKLNEEGKRIMGIIKGNTLRMGNLIDDLLAFSRLGKQELLKLPVDMNQLVAQIIEETNAIATNKITWMVKPLLSISADPTTIRQVWVNLLSNAVKYSGKESQPQITIDSYEDERNVVYFVRDNGVGFDEQYADKLFRVFQRLHGADEFDGTGVGLALVDRIVTRHGGKVWGHGQPGAGACFYFQLPKL